MYMYNDVVCSLGLCDVWQCCQYISYRIVSYYKSDLSSWEDISWFDTLGVTFLKVSLKEGSLLSEGSHKRGTTIWMKSNIVIRTTMLYINVPLPLNIRSKVLNVGLPYLTPWQDFYMRLSSCNQLVSDERPQSLVYVTTLCGQAGHAGSSKGDHRIDAQEIVDS